MRRQKPMQSTPRKHLLALALVLVLVASACGDDDDGGTDGAADQPDDRGAARSLTVYSGRDEELVGPLLRQFEEDTGIRVEVRYGETAELAATILEEGGNSPADVFFGQDAGALGALQEAGRFVELPADVLEAVDARFRSTESRWVGVSGRARTVVYNTGAVAEEDLPASILGFTDPAWRGRIGWAPTNGSFQAFVTALRVMQGDEAAREFLEGIRANRPQEYPNNTSIVQATIDGEVEVGFVNHYYLLRFLAESPDAPAANYFFPGGDPGSLVNVAGAGVLDTADHEDAAVELVRYLLSEPAQQYFAEETFEYPLVPGVGQAPQLPPLEELEQPDVDLSSLDDLEGTLELMRDVGLI